MRKHELKLREDYAEAKRRGEKLFELREDDRGYAVGDRVRYRVVDQLEERVEHPLEEKEFEIVYILRGFTRGLKENWVIWQEREVTKKKPMEKKAEAAES